ncbi:MAG: hypothetical protein DRQ61_01020 [Gammaproteobacteria bacterium]|nr:MAG: hypothetical protein DRQ56_00300 [Gammaproteobacteria bacterium]RLA24409.1 MAG: hypothetical protein DRQ61_01020 [Gammaproteobacteria bacterium]
MIFNDFRKAKQKSRNWRKSNKIIVATQGVFDILHFAHINYLAIAAKQGQKLIVAMDSDKRVRIRKGPDRPIQRWAIRSAQLDALGFIDAIFPKRHFVSNMFYAINIKPHVLVISVDSLFDDTDIRALTSRGVFVICLPRDPNISTTQLIYESKKRNKTLQQIRSLSRRPHRKHR